MEGYQSIEEQTQVYTELFWRLQQDEEADKGRIFREGRAGILERENAADIFLPAVCLRERCNLTETEYWLVMLAFCCEMEGGLCLDYREKRHESQPDLQYGLHLLSAVLPIDFGLVERICGTDSPMWEILKLPQRGQAGFLSRPLALGPGAFHFLLCGRLSGGKGYRFFVPGEEQVSGQPLIPLHEREYGRLSVLFSGEETPRILLYGPAGCGKHTLLKRVCAGESRIAAFVKAADFRGREEPEEESIQTLRLVCRLLCPVLVLELAGAAEAGSPARETEGWREFLLSPHFGDCPIVFLAENSREAEEAGRFADLRINLAGALSKEDTRLVLDSRIGPESRREWQDELLQRYRFPIGELDGKLRAVRLLAQEAGGSLTDRSLWIAGLKEHSMDFGLGRMVESCCTLDEIVLPRDCREQLETVLRLAKGWDGEQGLHLLFHGSSGTGKTMAASALAGELGFPLFKVDLSQVFDKYIGETEKHLDEIFRTAGRGRCLLFFDEADSLFGKRTDIRDAHDRYANVSTAYLLQRIEEYKGIVIMATNLLDHFDDAFVRRIRFVIKFRKLEREDRERMWEKALAADLKPAEDVSVPELARAVSLSPARIKAVAQVAGLLAGCEGSFVVTREHIRRALELETGKDETALRGF